MRASHGSPPEYPFATVSAYGPDNTRATKLVVGVFGDASQDKADPLRTWSCEAADVRDDPLVAEEVAAWLRLHGVKQTVSHDRIIGCPHEEGVDYPMGRACPRCPFWAGIDRFTHEPIPAPVATMSADQVLVELGADRTTPPLDALESADALRDVLVPPLLDTLERCVADPLSASDEEAQRFCYALYLLAKWRETRAYPLVIRWLSLPDAASTALSGDVLTQDGGRILAAVCDGDLEPIKRLVQDRNADEFSRGVALAALALLGAWAEVPLASIVEYFTWLGREGLERERNFIWSALALESLDIEALAVLPDLRRAHDDGLIDPRTISRSELDGIEGLSRGELLEEMMDRQPPIDDVAEATSWWVSYNQSSSRRGAPALEAGEWSDGPTEPYRAPPKIGRNEPCPCGSGKKYKKCCGA